MRYEGGIREMGSSRGRGHEPLRNTVADSEKLQLLLLSTSELLVVWRRSFLYRWLTQRYELLPGSTLVLMYPGSIHRDRQRRIQHIYAQVHCRCE